MKTFSEKLIEFFDNMPEPDRQLKVVTGPGGWKLINQSIENEVLKQRLRSILDKGKIEQSQYETLIQMIDSPDRENFELAKVLIQNYEDEPKPSKFEMVNDRRYNSKRSNKNDKYRTKWQR